MRKSRHLLLTSIIRCNPYGLKDCRTTRRGWDCFGQPQSFAHPTPRWPGETPPTFHFWDRIGRFCPRAVDSPKSDYASGLRPPNTSQHRHSEAYRRSCWSFYNRSSSACPRREDRPRCCHRHPIRVSGPSRLDPGGNVEEGELPDFWIQANHLVGGDGIQPNGSVRVHTHGIPAGVAGFGLWQLKNAEFPGRRVVAQPPAVGPAVHQPKFIVRTTPDTVQTKELRRRGRRRNVGVDQRLGIQAAQVASPSLTDPTVSL